MHRQLAQTPYTQFCCTGKFFCIRQTFDLYYSVPFTFVVLTPRLQGSRVSTIDGECALLHCLFFSGRASSDASLPSLTRFFSPPHTSVLLHRTPRQLFVKIPRFAFGLTIIAHRALLHPVQAHRYAAVVLELKRGYEFARSRAGIRDPSRSLFDYTL